VIPLFFKLPPQKPPPLCILPSFFPTCIATWFFFLLTPPRLFLSSKEKVPPFGYTVFHHLQFPLGNPPCYPNSPPPLYYIFPSLPLIFPEMVAFLSFSFSGWIETKNGFPSLFCRVPSPPFKYFNGGAPPVQNLLLLTLFFFLQLLFIGTGWLIPILQPPEFYFPALKVPPTPSLE